MIREDCLIKVKKKKAVDGDDFYFNELLTDQSKL